MRKLITRRNEASLRSHGFDVSIITDNDTGKECFWQVWNLAVHLHGASPKDELHLFIPDDFDDIDTERMIKIHSEMNKPYAMNVINDGRVGMWSGVMKADRGEYFVSGMVDCGFFCSSDVIKYLEVPSNISTVDSSGVGRHITMQLLAERIPMYTPHKSLAWHGDHDSIMHPAERKTNPLISL
jgi:hypothetical protein